MTKRLGRGERQRPLPCRSLLAAILLLFASGRLEEGVCASPPAVLRIAYTAELRSNLQPCACPANPPGGLARRIGFLDSLRAAVDPDPLLIVDAGRMMPERDRYPRLGPQALDRLRDLLTEAGERSAYDAIVSDDGSIPDERWVPPMQARRLRIGDRVIGIVALEESRDPLEAREAVERLGRVDLLLLLCSGDLHYAMRAAKLLGARAAVVARGAQFDPPILRDGVLFLGPGHDGKRVGYARVEIPKKGEIRVWEAQLRGMDGTVASDRIWSDRVERFLLDLDRENPGALAYGE